MSGSGFYGYDPYASERAYRPTGPRAYDPPPQHQLIYPREEQVYRACNQPPAPPPPAAPQPSTREVKIIYYVPGQPGDPNFLPPAPPALPAPVPMVVRVPAAPRSSYIEMPASSGGEGSNQFRQGDTFRVVAVEENRYSAQPYRYPGGYFDDGAGPHQGHRRGGY